MAQNIYRGTGYNIPTDVASEIIQKTQEESAIMRLARQITLPGRGLSIPVITGDPTAEWVAETDEKPVSNSTLSTKIMTPYKIAVIETFSKEFTRDAESLYDALVARLPGALAAVFDKTVIGGTQAPGQQFDTFANCTAQSINNANNGTYMGLVAADVDIANHGGTVTGFAFGAQGRGILLTATDTTNRPLFTAGTGEGAVTRVLGAPTYFNKAIYKAGTSGSPGTPAIVGIAGDWTKAMYGTVSGIDVSVTDTATLTSGATTLNLWQRNMVAVRAEIEIGFRAETDCFNLLTA